MGRMPRTKTMKTKRMNQQGFTLIELLVVIAIIAILASVSVPALQTAQLKAKQNKAMQQAIGISKGLRTWSLDEDGAYPGGDDANQAFAQLFPDFGKENVFFVRGSAWHGTGRFKTGPDELFGDEDEGGGGEALEAGENHWALNILADAEASANLPLMADGFSNQVGTYAREKSELGGIWQGRSAIVVYCDTSGKIAKLDKQSYKLINKKANNKDEFERTGVEMVNPARPSS
ncbi:MAG: prepilin-type N-terminal cleavage/methylation domain-containing protein [Verrucomicrobiales bacterium]|jgi:prepilin-type N-terminal cleavage/methylation domain-containing protein